MEQSEARMAPAWEEVLAQINATSSQRQAFIKHQQNFNAKLDCLPKIMQALSEHSDRLTALEQAHASIMSRQGDSNVPGFLREDSESLSRSSHNMLTLSGIPQTIADTPEEVVTKFFQPLVYPTCTYMCCPCADLQKVAMRWLLHFRELMRIHSQ